MTVATPLPRPGDHGGDGLRVAASLGVPAEEVLDLSASLNPVAPPVGPLVRRHLDAVERYPDPSRATAALAEALDIAPQRLVLTNGGAEAIALVAGELRRGRVDEPDFALYRRHLEEVVPDGPRFRSNPHNPTGALAGATERAAVWDEAFYPLATGTWTRGDADRGAVVVGSLTKLFACPGLRLGYVLTPPDDGEWARRVRLRQPQWSVNGLAGAVVPELVERADLRGWAGAVAHLRRGLVALLGRFGLAPEPSDANYVLVPGASWMRAGLAARGVIVRDCASFGLPGHVRVAVPSSAGLSKLEAALTAVCRDGPVLERGAAP